MPSDRRCRTILIVIENLAPLIGVLFFGWSVAPVMIVYWIENGLNGVMTAAKLALARGEGSSQVAGRVFLIGFFLVHYGIFWAVHGVFVFVLFVDRLPFREEAVAVPTREIVLAGVLITATLTVSIVRDALRPRAFERTPPRQIFASAYNRVVVLHLAVLIGGFAVLLLGSALPALVLLIVLKTVLELRTGTRIAEEIGEPDRRTGAA